MSDLSAHGLFGGGGFDLRKYTEINVDGGVAVPVSNTWTTAVDITGEGFLNLANILASATQTYSIRITVDGVIKYEASAGTTGSRLSGVAVIDLILPMSNSTTSGANGFYAGANGIFPYTSISAYPYVAGGVVSCILTLPIFFKTSLKIEVKSTGTGSVPTFIKGGVKSW